MVLKCAVSVPPDIVVDRSVVKAVEVGIPVLAEMEVLVAVEEGVAGLSAILDRQPMLKR